MGKLALKHDLALNAKIKSDSCVEVTVIDHTTKEMFIYELNFRESRSKPHAHKVRMAELDVADVKNTKDEQVTSFDEEE